MENRLPTARKSASGVFRLCVEEISRKVAKEEKTEVGFSMTENEISKEVVDAAFKIHTKLGPGLPESVYETVLAYE